MCTIGYHKNLSVVFKNRDKTDQTREEILTDDRFIACRTIGAPYYSWGINRRGCAFVSAAINTPEWTRLVMDGDMSGAEKQYTKENQGLTTPMARVSALLPDVRSASDWLDNLKRSPEAWMAYNLLVADRNCAYVVELYREELQVRQIDKFEIVTNHFNDTIHGPQRASDYPSSFKRHDMASSTIQSVQSAEDIQAMLRNGQKETGALWRHGRFFTVSSAVLNMNEGGVEYARSENEDYMRFLMNDRPAVCSPVFEDLGKFEMSRYIDLELYHEVERSHPYYEEMIEEVCATLKNFCDPEKTYRVLELGAGTGLCTGELLQFANLEVSALEIDSECCQVMQRHLDGRKCDIVNGDAVTFCREGYYDVVVSTFAHDHIHYDKATEFVRNIKRNLRPGGIYIMGGEILPYYETSEQRKHALLTYHGFIVNKALWEGHYRVAQIEINALESGIDMVGDFKRHESMYEQEMEAGSMTLQSKKKIGPQDPADVGGIFVYEFSKE